MGSSSAAEDPITFIVNELKAGRKTIVVPPGVYKVTPKAKEGRVFLTLENLENVTIDLTGVEFRGTEPGTVFDIRDCVDLTIKGLTIDFDPLPFTQARIVEIDQEKNWTVEIIDGYPNDFAFKKAVEFWPIQVYGKDSHELVNPMRYEDNVDILRVDQGTYRITGGKDRRGEVGDIAVFSTSPKGHLRTSYSTRCTNLHFENITIYSSQGMAFYGEHNNRTVYRNCRIDRRPPEQDFAERGMRRLRSINHDGFHSRDAIVGPQIIGCTARYQSDDCVNICGMYAMVSRVAGDELRILTHQPWKWEQLSGDSLQVMSFDGQCPPDVKTVRVTPDGGITQEEVAFVRSLPLWPGFHEREGTPFRHAFKVKIEHEIALAPGSVVISKSRGGNGFVIRDCTFGHIRSRGLLIKASGGVIENNTIDACWSAGMQISPEYQWMEGGCSSDLEIIGNRLSGNRGGGISIYGRSGGGVSLPANSHRDIAIEGNEIRSPTPTGIHVSGCTGLAITGNALEVTGGDPSKAIALENVADVSQEDNTVGLLP